MSRADDWGVPVGFDRGVRACMAAVAELAQSADSVRPADVMHVLQSLLPSERGHDRTENGTVLPHDPLCPNRPCTCDDGHLPGCNPCCQCSLIAKVRAEYANPACVWSMGDCAPSCPSCRRLDELLGERVAGYREGIDDCLGVVEHLHDHEAPHAAHRDALWNALVAMRALKERELGRA